MALVRNLLQVSAHLGDLVRASGATPVAVPGGTQWHRDLLSGASRRRPSCTSTGDINAIGPHLSRAYDPPLIPFVTRLVGGTTNRVQTIFTWRERLGEAFRHLGGPQYVELDEARNCVWFSMPRMLQYVGDFVRSGRAGSDKRASSCSMVRNVMRESGMTIAGVRFEFEPTDTRDAIPVHDRPRPRAVAVIFHLPPRIKDLLKVLHLMRLPSALLDGKHLPHIRGFANMRYGLLTAPDIHADCIDKLDRTWVADQQLRVLWLKDAETVFAAPGRLMDQLHVMAKAVVADKGGFENPCH
ncbi:hypothetical protein GGF32_005033 [Allomyces javanicus]|nr:hypothetical protein GGF32_005033 [Allomyces javanicus]